MTNAKGSTNAQMTKKRCRLTRFVIRISSLIRHETFALRLPRRSLGEGGSFSSQMLDHVVAKLRALDLGRAFHQTRKIVSDAFARNGAP